MKGGCNMRLSTKCRYGARALIEIARNYGKEPIKRKAIVETQNIPDSYLENILLALKTGGLIVSIRGANGGYSIKRDPSSITMYDVVSLLEGKSSITPCVDNEDVCERSSLCATRPLWKKMQEVSDRVLRSETIQNMLDCETGSDVLDYSI